jgi:hypothetical protein
MMINEDGNIPGGFSKIKLPYPSPHRHKETYAEYRERVNKLADQGFHLGDLSWDDYQTYCMGSGYYEGANSEAIIGGRK